MAFDRFTWYRGVTWLILLHTVGCQVLQQPPTFTSSGPYVLEVSDQINSVLTLPCVAFGVPKPTYSWLYNGQPYTGQVQPVSEGTLVFNDVSRSLNGYYQCIAQNSVGTALSNNTQVIVARQAAFSDSAPVVKSFPLASSYSLQCNVLQTSIPAPRVSALQMDVSWQYKSQTQPILLSTRIQIDSTGALHNAFAIQGDSSTDPVCCHVKNRLIGVEAEGSCYTVTISPTGSPQPAQPTVLFYPNMTNNPGGDTTTVVALEGRNSTLRCFFGGSSGIQYAWTRTDAPLPTDGRVQQLSNFIELTIFRVQKSDQGTYLCQGSGLFQGITSTKTVTINLIVNSAPRFLDIGSQPHDTNATVGSDVYMQCNSYAVPDAVIQWYKNGNPINPAATPGFSLSNGGRTLVIKNVCKDKCSAGGNGPMVIQCNASNTYGYVFANGYINVFLKTMIAYSQPSTQAQIGKQMNFSVTATSDPNTPITYSWYFTPFSSDPNNPKPEVLLANSDKLSISPNGSVLFINEVAESDIGTYRVVAANGVDQAEAKFQLNAPPYLSSAYVWPYWWILLIIVLVVVIFICVICIVCYCLRVNRGDEYPVDEKEREADRDPVKELSDTGFQDYVRKSDVSTISRSYTRGYSSATAAAAAVYSYDNPSFHHDYANVMYGAGSYMSGQTARSYNSAASATNRSLRLTQIASFTDSPV